MTQNREIDAVSRSVNIENFELIPPFVVLCKVSRVN